MNKILYSVLAGILALGMILVSPKMLVAVLVIFVLGLLAI